MTPAKAKTLIEWAITETIWRLEALLERGDLDPADEPATRRWLRRSKAALRVVKSLEVSARGPRCGPVLLSDGRVALCRRLLGHIGRHHLDPPDPALRRCGPLTLDDGSQITCRRLHGHPGVHQT